MSNETRKRDWFPFILIGGIIIGSFIGVFFGNLAVLLKPLGDIFLNLLFTIVTPMVFVSITTAVGNMINLRRLGKILGSTALIFIVTGLFAAALILITLNFFPIGVSGHLSMDAASEMQKAKSGAELLVGALTVSDFPAVWSKSHMLPLIIFSIIFGLAVSYNGGQESAVGKFLNNLNDVITTMIDIVMKFAPIGLGAYFASLVHEFGPSLIGSYGRVLAIYYPIIIIYMILMFPIYSYFSGGMDAVHRMRSVILKPALTAFATQSSVATLPANKQACDEIGVPQDISDVVLPLGATMHMDGSVISGLVKITFLFAIFNIPFVGAETYATAIVVSILSAFVLSGAPGGGLVGELLIVSLFNFPPEAFPIIATIGFLVDAPATMLNASGDTIASMMVARLVEGKNWLKEKDRA